MFAEIAAIMWKEWRQLLQRTGGKVWVFVLRILLSFVFIALIIPVEIENGAIVDYSWNLVWVTMPSVIVLGLVSFSFAGERETHTLPTLLASPLSDRALVLGKIGFPVIYGFVCSLIITLCLLVKINIVSESKELILYSQASFVSGLLTSWLVATFVGTLGVYTSMKSPTIRQAQTSLVLTMLVVAFLPLISFVASAFLIPQDIKTNIIEFVAGLNSSTVIVIILLGLAVFDLILIFLVLKWFDRDKLLTVN
ncbi:MAG: ABC transporter permease [Prochloraceae cyanobacterium]